MERRRFVVGALLAATVCSPIAGSGCSDDVPGSTPRTAGHPGRRSDGTDATEAPDVGRHRAPRVTPVEQPSSTEDRSHAAPEAGSPSREHRIRADAGRIGSIWIEAPGRPGEALAFALRSIRAEHGDEYLDDVLSAWLAGAAPAGPSPSAIWFVRVVIAFSAGRESDALAFLRSGVASMRIDGGELSRPCGDKLSEWRIYAQIVPVSPDGPTADDADYQQAYFETRLGVERSVVDRVGPWLQRVSESSSDASVAAAIWAGLLRNGGLLRWDVRKSAHVEAIDARLEIESQRCVELGMPRTWLPDARTLLILAIERTADPGAGVLHDELSTARALLRTE